MKNKKMLEELLTQGASEYAYECDESDFNYLVKVTCEYGWAKAEIVEIRKEDEE